MSFMLIKSLSFSFNQHIFIVFLGLPSDSEFKIEWEKRDVFVDIPGREHNCNFIDCPSVDG